MALVVIKTEDAILQLQESFNCATDLQKGFAKIKGDLYITIISTSVTRSHFCIWTKY